MWFEAILFVLLSPGLLLTIPPVGKSFIASGKTSIQSVIVHALIFGVIVYFKSSIPFLKSEEGFQTQRNVYELFRVFRSYAEERGSIELKLGKAQQDLQTSMSIYLRPRSITVKSLFDLQLAQMLKQISTSPGSDFIDNIYGRDGKFSTQYILLADNTEVMYKLFVSMTNTKDVNKVRQAELDKFFYIYAMITGKKPRTIPISEIITMLTNIIDEILGSFGNTKGSNTSQKINTTVATDEQINRISEKLAQVLGS